MLDSYELTEGRAVSRPLLDNNTDFRATAGQTAYKERRRNNYRRRYIAQIRELNRAKKEAKPNPNNSQELIKTSRMTFCGQPRYGSGAVSIKHEEHKAKAHYSGLAFCGNIWLCPVCSSIIRAKRAEEIKEATRRHLDKGGSLFMVTYTVQHNQSDSLKASLDVLSGAMASMQRSRAYRDFKNEIGLTGNVKSLEVTYGVSGWHPHNHGLYFSDAKLTHADAQGIKDELFSMWAHQVDRSGGRPVSYDAFDVQVIETGEESVGAYIAKINAYQGIACELSLGDIKAGRAEKSISPFELLDINTPEAIALWNEYAMTTKGKSAIRWSRGLRDALGMVKEQTDEEVIEEAEQRGEAIAFIDRTLYREKVARNHNAQSELLELVESKQLEAVADMLGVVPYHVIVNGTKIPIFTRWNPDISSGELIRLTA